jgi:hypothetical protein
MTYRTLEEEIKVLELGLPPQEDFLHKRVMVLLVED